MTTSYVDADSMLVVDVGSVNTRATLFDLVDSRYRFVAGGTAPTTAGAPYMDVREGVNQAIGRLQTITGRTLLGENGLLIMPMSGGVGVDKFAATISAGPPLKIVLVGLLEDVSLDSVRRLAATTYGEVLDTISLNDRRKTENRIDAIIKVRPDLVLVAGGTEGGASQTVLKLLDAVGLASYLLPELQRPEILFAGNAALQNEVETRLKGITNLHFAPNIRPMLEVEQLETAHWQIAHLYGRLRNRQMQGVLDLENMANGALLPTATAFGRMTRLLSKLSKTRKGVLGIDIGASSTTLAAAFGDTLSLRLFPEFGLGAPAARMLEYIPVNEISRWLPLPISASYLREFLYNKSLYPASIPISAEELAVEEATARTILRHAMNMTSDYFLANQPITIPGQMPVFEPILASGSVFSNAPSLGHALLTILDGLQPVGITTITLDKSHLAAALGTAASINPLLAVQILESNAFVNLATVISPIGQARTGVTVLRARLIQESSGRESVHEIKQGSVEVLPLAPGQIARIQLTPFHRYDLGLGGPGRGGTVRAMGSALGVVIDARGRPIRLPEDVTRRQETLKKWLWTLGG